MEKKIKKIESLIEMIGQNSGFITRSKTSDEYFEYFDQAIAMVQDIEEEIESIEDRFIKSFINLKIVDLLKSYVSVVTLKSLTFVMTNDKGQQDKFTEQFKERMELLSEVLSLKLKKD